MGIPTIKDKIYAMRNSERIAVVCKGEEVTYNQLWIDAYKIAIGLLKAGVKKGDRVAVSLDRTTDYFRTMVGIAVCGAIGVTIDRFAPKAHSDHIISNCEPTMIVDKERVHEWISSMEYRDFDDESDSPFPNVGDEDIFWIVYTSGSTGSPKGVVVQYGTIGLGYCPERDEKCRYLLEHCDRFLVDSSFSYSASHVVISMALLNGKTLVLASSDEFQSPALLAQCIIREHVDYMLRPPTWILEALKEKNFAKAISRLKVIDVGGEMITNDALRIVEKFAPDAVIYLTYGSTETMPISTYRWENDNAGQLGNVVKGYTTYLLDEEGRQIGPGQIGELCHGGMIGEKGFYWNDPEITQKKYIVHKEFGRLFHTGDLVYYDYDGKLFLRGRNDNMVNIHGARVEPEYPEKVIGEFAGINEVAVVAVGDVNKVLCAYYTCDADYEAAVNELELKTYLIDILPYYMIPVHYFKMEKMPLNASGKLDRKELVRMFNERETTSVGKKKEGCTPTEEMLCRVFAQVLGRDESVGADENFFELGGDSVLALEMSYLIEQEGYSFDIRWMYVAPTPELLATFLISSDKDKGKADGKASKPVSEIRERQRRTAEESLGKSISSVHPVNACVVEQLAKGNAWMRFSVCAVNRVFDKAEWKKRVQEVVGTHEILRSVFLKQENQYIRAVLTEAEPENFYVDLSQFEDENDVWSEKQRQYFDSMTGLLLKRETPIFGNLMFTMGCIRLSGKTSVLVLCYSHALLDVIGADNLLRDVVRNEETVSDTELFERRTERILNEDRKTSLKYWGNVCEGFRNSDIIEKTKENDQSDVSDRRVQRRRITGDRQMLERAINICEAKGISFATFVHTLLGRALCSLSGKEQAFFLSICAGRSREEIRLAGMFATMFPFSFKAKDTWADVQVQLLNSQNHAWVMEDPECFSDFVENSENYLILDVLDDFNHKRLSDTDVNRELDKELQARELLLQHKTKMLEPKEDGRPIIYVSKLWSEMFVIEFTTDMADEDYICRVGDAIKSEFYRMVSSEERRKKLEDGGYMASVLSPVHEVDLSLLERARKSLVSQTFGFDNIEWIVVLHNCSSRYKEEVHQLYDRYSNIVFVEREQENTGLAYARTRTVEAATGKYLFFLDGDDEITPTCVAEAVNAMEETGADIAVWSVETRLNEKSIWFCCDADPVKGRLIIDRGDYRFGNSLCYSGLGLWSRAVRREFIKEKNVCFDEKSPREKTCRDVIFNMNALLEAERIVILPQLTGYIYHAGNGVFAKRGSKIIEDVMDVVKSYLSFYRKEGLQADNVIWIMMTIGLMPKKDESFSMIKEDYMVLLKACFETLNPPKMNWPRLQMMADLAYIELRKIVE